MAVDYCHAMGIRIQDLRPHNMLLVEPNDAPSLCRCAPTCAAPMHVRNLCRENCFDNLYAGSHCKMSWEWQTLTWSRHSGPPRSETLSVSSGCSHVNTQQATAHEGWPRRVFWLRLSCLCSIASTGDPCVQPEGGLGLSGVPRLKLMLTQMEQENLEASPDDSAAPTFTRADYAAPEVRPWAAPAGTHLCQPVCAKLRVAVPLHGSFFPSPCQSAH